MKKITEISDRIGIPWLDTLMILINMEGIKSSLGEGRYRIKIKPLGEQEVWQIIVPVDADNSPFHLIKKSLFYQGDLVADVTEIENDDIVLVYQRASGSVLTLNSNSRSACVGCVFCYNVLEDPADATITSREELQKMLSWYCADQGWTDLSHVKRLTVCSGCFRNAKSTIRHLHDLKIAGSNLGFNGVVHILSSEIREKEDLIELQQRVEKAHITLTLECFTRRNILLKDTKASLSFEKALQVLEDGVGNGLVMDFTYISGLDPLSLAITGVAEMASRCNWFPKIQVYQCHNDYMLKYRHPDAESIDYHAKLRSAVEPVMEARGLSLYSWENYRPLWYSTFAGVKTHGPRI